MYSCIIAALIIGYNAMYSIALPSCRGEHTLCLPVHEIFASASGSSVPS